MLVTVQCQNLNHLCVRWCFLRNGYIIGWLGEDGSIVVVVHNSDVNLDHVGKRQKEKEEMDERTSLTELYYLALHRQNT